MDNRTLEKLHRINYLIAETDALYHQASLKLGISDSAMRVLYTVYDCGGAASSATYTSAPASASRP